MKLTYQGRPEDFSPRQAEKLEAKLEKLSRLLDRDGGREAHVAVKRERFLNHVEVTLHAFDHSLAGEGAARDLFAALNEALDRIEKQIVKLRARWRVTKRHRAAPHRTPEEAAARAAAPAARSAAPAAKKKTAAPRRTAKVFRVNHNGARKPMTLDEAVIEIEKSDRYVVYRDASTGGLSVLVRRADGHLDLIES